ncbi:MAG: amino acid adenylation domain-containing protein [Bacteroidia bacterium]
MTQADIQDIFPLSPQQQGILFHLLSTPHSGVYVEQFQLKIEGEIEIKKLQNAINEWVIANDILRTAFVYEGIKEPMQVVLKQRTCLLESENISELATDIQSAYLFAKIEALQEIPFQLNKESLVKIHLFQLAAAQYQLVFTYSHLLLDGWSAASLFYELLQLYFTGVSSSSKKPSYKRYVQWLKQQSIEESEKFWSEELSSIEVPTFLSRNKNPQNQALAYHFYIENENHTTLQVFCQTHKITPSTFFHALISVLLSTYTNQQKIIVGSVFSGRPSEESLFQEMAGCFVQSFPLISEIIDNEEFVQLCGHIQKKTSTLLSHSQYHASQIKKHHTAFDSLFDCLISYENYPSFSLKNSELAISIAEIYTYPHYPLNVIIFPEEKRFHLVLRYQAQAFETWEIELFSAQLQKMCAFVLENEKISVEKLKTHIKYKQWEESAHNAMSISSENQTITKKFEGIAKLFAEKIALSSPTQTYTYQALQKAADKLSFYLQSHITQSKPDFLRVAVLCNRSPEMIATFLGILKAGACYLPIENDQPWERILMLLEDAKPQLVIYFDEKPPFLENIHARSYAEIEEKVIDYQEVKDLSKAQQAAYMIYTSGTTGKPKGCLIRHESVVQLIENTNNPEYFTFSSSDIWVMAHSPAFDFSVWEMFGALFTGATLILPPKNVVQNIETFHKMLKTEKVSILNQTPRAFYALAEYDALSQEKQLNTLKYVIFGGDALDFTRLSTWVEKYPLAETALINMYGITETTVHVTYYQVRDSDIFSVENKSKANIGKPFKGMIVNILDPNQQPLQIGYEGEIYVTGTGVSLGYFERETLTKEKFVTIQGRTWYKSGDLGRYDAKGNIEYLGRNDKQVKVRGHRVELAEIEAVVRKMEGVKEVFVFFDNTKQQLQIYLVSRLTEQAIHAKIAAVLPTYMLPQAYFFVENFLLTRNRKLDVNTLLQNTYVKNSNGNTEQKLENKFFNDLQKVLQNVLSVSEITSNSHFFQLGGDSIKAIQVISQLRKAGYSLSVKDLFQTPIMRDLCEKMQEVHPQKAHFSVEKDLIWLEKVQAQFPQLLLEDIYELSPAQEGLFIEFQKNTDNQAYTEQFVVKLSTKASLPQIQAAYKQLITLHPILRTLFLIDENGKPFQVVLAKGEADISTFHNTLNISNIEILERKKSFEIHKKPPIRLAIIEDKQDTAQLIFTLIWTHHHILLDGWCLQLLIQNFFEILNKSIENQAFEENKPSLYRHYVRYVHQLDKAKMQQFWKSYLQGYEHFAVLPTYQAKTSEYVAKRAEFQFSKAESFLLKRLASRHNITLNTLFQVVWAILLQRYNRQEEVVFGTVFSGRPHEIENIENMIGLFIQTIPVRVKCTKKDTILGICRHFQKEWIENQAHFYLNLGEIQAQSTFSNELFSHILVFENYPTNQQLFQQKNIEILDNHYFEQTHYAANVIIYPNETEIGVHFLHNENAFQLGIFGDIFQHFRTLLMQCSQENFHTLTIQQLSLCKKEDLQLLETFNNTGRYFPENEDIITKSIFEQAVHYPTRIAAKDANFSFTYQEIDHLSLQLAAYFWNETAFQVGDKVGVCLMRDSKVTISLLAILRAGGVYVPIEMAYPDERISYMIEDAQPRIIITDSEHFERLSDLLSNTSVLIYCLDLHQLQNEKRKIEVKLPTISPHSPSFLIYTSGSTGKPKGVLQTHLCLSNLIAWQCQFSGMSLGMKVLQNSALGFDASIHEILYALLSGGSIISISEENKKDLFRLQEVLENEQIELVWLPISLLNGAFEVDKKFLSRHQHLKCIVATGEQLKIGAGLHHFLTQNPYIRLYNFYGPSETHVVTSHTINANLNNINTLPPIGKAISNTYIHILDETGHRVPPFVTGELFLGGNNVGIGYWKLEALTNQRFIKNEEGLLFYKSGDLGYHDKEGNIYFVGRADEQLKIRGFRVEIQEIEAILLSHSLVNQCIICVIEQQEKQVVAFLQAKKAAKELPNLAEMRAFLSEKLPDFMLPSHIEWVAEIPINQNGKADRKKLLQQLSFAEKDNENDLILDAYTLTLAQIWEELLGKKNLYASDDFFLLGGHSLTAMKLLAKIRQKLGIQISIKTIFQYRTLQALSDYLQTLAIANEKRIIPDFIEKERYVLSSAQMKIWVHQQLTQNEVIFLMEMNYQVEGKLDFFRLELAVLRLLEKYPILRTVFFEAEGNVWQKIGEIPAFYAQNPQTLVATNVFNLQIKSDTESLFKVSVKIHHLISDGVTNQLLMKALWEFYAQEKVTIPTQEETLSYFAYCEYEQNLLQSEEFILAKQQTIEALDKDLPTDFDAQTDQDRAAICREIEFENADYQKVILFCQQHQLQVAYFWLGLILLWKTRFTHHFSGNIGFAVNGRYLPETQNILGLFAEVLPYHYQFERENELVSFLQQLQNEVTSEITQQKYPFHQLYENRKYQVVFNYWNEIIQPYFIEAAKISPILAQPSVAKYQIEIQYLAKENACALQLIARKASFSEESVQLMNEELLQIFQLMLSNEKVEKCIEKHQNFIQIEENTEIEFDF